MHGQCLNFITLSSLMGSRSLSGMPTGQLKARMEDYVGAQIDSLSSAKLPKALQVLRGHKKPLDWLKNMVRYSDLLRSQGLDYLVLDTLQYTPESELDRITPILQTLSQQGVQIVVVDQDQSPIFFASMREVICTDDFMRIYVKSLWMQSRVLEPKRIRRTESPVRAPGKVKEVEVKVASLAKPAAGFRFMERIFVA